MAVSLIFGVSFSTETPVDSALKRVSEPVGLIKVSKPTPKTIIPIPPNQW